MFKNLAVPNFLRKHDDALCNSCHYRNMDEERPCWDCVEDCSLFDEDSGYEFIDRCRNHLLSLPAAVSGEHGTAQTRHVAAVIFHDLALDDVNGWILLLEYNARCQPPWLPEQLRHIMQQAIDQPQPDRPRGTLRDRFVAEIDDAIEEQLLGFLRDDDQLTTP